MSVDWPAEFLHALRADQPAGPDAVSPMTHLRVLPAVTGVTGDWPSWVPSELRAAYAAHRIDRPWQHQLEAAEAANAGRSVVISTGTATGKSLAYQLPVLSSLLSDRRATALYLSPTKALGNDQLRAVLDLGVDPGGSEGFRASTYDGDTPHDERGWVQEHSRWIFSNPDMLSRSLLPMHANWHVFLRGLRYVVIDECHSYRGIFGSHIAHVLRRLRRICTRYGAAPTFILASATVREPEAAATRLTGVDCLPVTSTTAPRGERTFALWEPPLSTLTGDNGAPVRRSANAEAATLMADLVIADRRTLTFVRSRRAAETVTLQARERLVEAGARELAPQIASYRAGYLPEDRRALEVALSSGTLRAAAATTALELGIDIAGLDAVVVAGFPGTLASLWQQVGRAGRQQERSLAIFVARDDPLDTYLVHHPESIFGRPMESTVIDPANPYVLGPQLSCAAHELPITEEEVQTVFGGQAALAVLAELVASGVVRRRPHGWFWTSPERPHADLRGAGGEVALVEEGTARLIGTIDDGAAPAQVHPGAVYLHAGETWTVQSLDLADRSAVLRAEAVDYSTYSQEQTDIRLIDVLESRSRGAVTLQLVSVEVSNQVVSYQRRRLRTGEVIDQIALDLPRRELRTKAVLWTLDVAATDRLGLNDPDLAAVLPGALHAAEHAAIGLLPLVATCDRWDIGGVSTALHPDTGLPSVFIYDGYPGGAGFAERGYRMAEDWLSATRAAICSCECASGCPSCVQSPKCGNGNDPLDKDRAIDVLGIVLDALRAPTSAIC